MRKFHAISFALKHQQPEKFTESTAITHADIWRNDIKFKYDENGKPIEAGFLDWQIARNSSPVLDIVYCIFYCTTKELRSQYYDEFLQIYYESLTLLIRKYVTTLRRLTFRSLKETIWLFIVVQLVLKSRQVFLLRIDDGASFWIRKIRPNLGFNQRLLRILRV